MVCCTDLIPGIYWPLSDYVQHLAGVTGLPSLQRPTLPEGIPREAEYVSWYCQALGVVPPSAEDWAFYLVSDENATRVDYCVE